MITALKELGAKGPQSTEEGRLIPPWEFRKSVIIKVIAELGMKECAEGSLTEKGDSISMGNTAG